VDRNIHEIEIESKAARIFTRTENVLHPRNPKTVFWRYSPRWRL
jgi:predicted dinucleotide-utilizing enzyme